MVSPSPNPWSVQDVIYGVHPRWAPTQWQRFQSGFHGSRVHEGDPRLRSSHRSLFDMQRGSPNGQQERLLGWGRDGYGLNGLDGLRGFDGFHGLNGLMGLNGTDGQDAPYGEGIFENATLVSEDATTAFTVVDRVYVESNTLKYDTRTAKVTMQLWRFEDGTQAVRAVTTSVGSATANSVDSVECT